MKMLTPANPENPRMILVRINSMDHYDGTHEIGVWNFEAWNFKPFDGHYYGAIPRNVRIDLVRLGGGTQDQSVNDVTVVWIADNKIVGWYLNALVFAEVQKTPPSNNYRATCLVENGRELLPPERMFDIKAAGIRFGISDRRYPNAVKDREFICRVREYIEKVTNNAGMSLTP